MCGPYHVIYACAAWNCQTSREYIPNYCDLVKHTNRDNLLETAKWRSGTGCKPQKVKDQITAECCPNCHEPWEKEAHEKWDQLWDSELLPMAWNRTDLNEAKRQILAGKVDRKRTEKDTELMAGLLPDWKEVMRIREDDTKEGKEALREQKKKVIYQAYPAHVEKVRNEMIRYITAWPKDPQTVYPQGTSSAGATEYPDDSSSCYTASSYNSGKKSSSSRNKSGRSKEKSSKSVAQASGSQTYPTGSAEYYHAYGYDQGGGSQGYGSSSGGAQGYGAGSQGYGSAQGYGAGSQSYGSAQGYEGSSQGYGSAQGYGGTQQYGSGSQGYSGDSQGYGSGSQGYGGGGGSSSYQSGWI